MWFESPRYPHGHICVANSLLFRTKVAMCATVARKDYPLQLSSIGKHIRKARLDRELLQKHVAENIGVTACSINNWELNHGEPEVRYMPAIIKFLGYVPFECPDDTLGKLAYYKRVNGYSFERLGEAMGKDPEQLMDWLNGKHKPFLRSLARIEDFLTG